MTNEQLAYFKFQLQMASKDRTPECIVNPFSVLELIEKIEELDSSNNAYLSALAIDANALESFKVKLRIAKTALTDAADDLACAVDTLKSSHMHESAKIYERAEDSVRLALKEIESNELPKSIP